MTMRTEREKMLAGEPYDPLDPELAAARARARDLCRPLNATRESDSRERRRILTELLGEGGESVLREPPCHCDYGSKIGLGTRVFCNIDCIVHDVCEVRIEDRTLSGPGVKILTAMHPLDAAERRAR